MLSRNSFSLVDIESALCTRYAGLQLRHLQGRKRGRAIAYPRFIAIHLARTHTRLSLTQLGERYHRDHTSILHGQRRADGLLRDNEKFRADYAAVAEILHQAPRQIDRLSALVIQGIVRHQETPAAIAASWV